MNRCWQKMNPLLMELVSPLTSRRSLVKWSPSGNWMGPLDPPPPCCSRGTPLTMFSSTHISLIVNRSSYQPLIRSQNYYTVSNYLRIMCAMKRRSRHCSNHSWMISTGLKLSREHLRYDWIQLIYPKYCSQFLTHVSHTQILIPPFKDGYSKFVLRVLRIYDSSNTVEGECVGNYFWLLVSKAFWLWVNASNHIEQKSKEWVVSGRNRPKM